MRVRTHPHNPHVFAILDDAAHIRRIGRVALADSCVVGATFGHDYPFRDGDGPFLEVVLDYGIGLSGATEIAHAWLAASALLPEVTL